MKESNLPRANEIAKEIEMYIQINRAIYAAFNDPDYFKESGVRQFKRIRNYYKHKLAALRAEMETL